VPNADAVTLAGAQIVGVDGSVPPAASNVRTLTRATLALTWQAPRGFFVGAGYSWNFPREDRSGFTTDEDGVGDFADIQVRIGYYPGGRLSEGERLAREQALRDEAARAAPSQPAAPPVPEAPPAAPAPPPAPAPAPAAPVGAGEPGAQALTFEDVHFDFDRYTLRPDALRLLDDAVAALAKSPSLNIQIEGHTCNIGTAEYNLALGDRRANAVRDYLISRGVSAGRLTSVSYGEERPRHDNTREETRRLNRRAALVVRIQ
jgi:outer membrane protein OmpA-like peptidoglycan-associated protein